MRTRRGIRVDARQGAGSFVAPEPAFRRLQLRLAKGGAKPRGNDAILGSTGDQARMTNLRKIEAAKQLMAARGIAKSTAAPPLWELLWSLGVYLPPPLYMGFASLFVFTGSFFGIVFGVGVWIARTTQGRPMSLHEAGAVALVTGIGFGLAVAGLTRRLARRHALGAWSAF
jgi:hypothetical protein